MSDTRTYRVARGPFRVPSDPIPEGAEIQLDSAVAAEFVRDGALNPVGFEVDGSGQPVPTTDEQASADDAAKAAAEADAAKAQADAEAKQAKADAQAAADAAKTTATELRGKSDELKAALTDASTDEEKAAAAAADQSATDAETAATEAQAKADALPDSAPATGE